jgi:DNA-binding MarR family transcriptional regulator
MTNIYERIGAYSPQPKAVLFNSEMKGSELKLYQLILELSDNSKGYCYCVRERLAGFMGMSTRNLDRIIKRLIDAGYIKKERGVSGSGRCEIRLACLPIAAEERAAADKNVQGTWTETSRVPRQKCPGYLDKNVQLVQVPRTMYQELRYQDHVCTGAEVFEKKEEAVGADMEKQSTGFDAVEKDESVCDNACSSASEPKTDFHAWFAASMAAWNAQIPDKRYTGNSLQLTHSTLRDLLTICTRFPDPDLVTAAVGRYARYRAAPPGRRKYGKRHEYSGMVSFLEFGLEIFSAENVLADLLSGGVKPDDPAKPTQSLEEYKAELEKRLFGADVKKNKEAA